MRKWVTQYQFYMTATIEVYAYIPSIFLEASVSPVPTRSADREDKWQQKSVPPSSPSSSPSSSPLQSVRDTAQPSWMEVAKRKSLAWSDKTMD